MRFSFLSAPSPKPPSSLASSRKPAGNGRLKNGAIRIEPLESRIALSISIKAVGTDIFISGDNTANHLAVFEDGAGRLFIYGDVNTAVTGDGTVAGVLPDTNAGGGREFDNGTFKNLYVSLGSADDSVDVAGLHSSEVASLTVNTGAATTGDKVVFGTSTFAGNPDADFGASTIAGPVTILTGNGGNTVTLRNLTANALYVGTGSGNDTLNLATTAGLTIHGDATIDAGDGSNVINTGVALNFTVIDGNLNIILGSGNDSVTLDYLTVGNVKGSLNISTGLGDDVVKLASAGDVSVPHGSAIINTGDASTIDSVTIGSANHVVMISGDLAIHTGSGDDAVILDSLTVGSTFGSITINTGTGGDTITLGANGNITVANGSVSIDTGDSVSDAVLIGTAHSVTISGDLSIHTGDGNDIVTIDQLTCTNLDLHTNGGLDTVTVAGTGPVTVHGSATIDTGDVTTGGDIVHVGGGATVVVGKTLAVTLGNGDDMFSLDHGNFAGAVLIDGGTGNNTINIGSIAAVAVTNLLSIQTGAGADNVNTSSLAAGSLAIDTGLGVDTASLQHLTVAGLASIRVADHDRILTLASQAIADVTISAGASHATIALGAGIHKTKIVGPDRKDFPIKHLKDAIGITFKPRAAESRDATLRLIDKNHPHHKVTFRLEGYSPVSIDLAPTIKRISLPKTPIVAGSTKKIKVPIAISNVGNTAVPKGSKVDVQIYVHNTGTNADTLITTLSHIPVSTLAAGKSKSLRHAIAMPDSLAAGIYEVLVKIVDVSPFVETSILNNSITSSQTFQVTT